MKRLFLLLATTLLLAGCGAKDNTPLPKNLTKYQAMVKPVVLFSSGATDGVKSQTLQLGPAVAGDLLVTVSVDGDVNAKNRVTGRTIWQHDTKLPLSATPFIGKKAVYVVSLNGKLQALSLTTGKKLRQTNLPSSALAAPAVGNGVVVVHAHDGSLVAFSTKTGKQLWLHNTVTPKLSLNRNSSPVIVKNAVIAGFDDGTLGSFNLQTGKINWTRPIAIPTGGSEISRMVDITATPIIKSGIIYAVTYHGNVVAVRVTNGELVWQNKVSSYQGLVVTTNQVIVVTAASGVVSFDRSTGRKLWVQNSLKFRSLTTPALFGNSVVVGDFAGYLHFLSIGEGKLLARVKIDSSGLDSAPVVLDNRVYVTANDGEVASLRLDR